jgi:hypothetical protein
MTTAPKLRRSVFSSTALALFAVAFLIVRNELDRLVGEVLSADGHTHSLSDATGFAAAVQTNAWAAWKSASAAASAQSFIAIATCFEVLFLACAAVLVYRLIQFSARAWTSDHPGSDVSVVKASAVLIAAVGAGVLGGVIVLLLDSLPTAPGWLTVVLAVVSYVRLAAVVLLALQLLLSEVMGTVVRRFLALGIRAIYAQRLLVIVVFAVGALSLLPLPNLFEQISDVYRGWVTYPADAGYLPTFSGPVIATLVLDFVAFALTGISLFALGRQRARHYARLTEADDRPAGRYRYWIIFALAVALVAVIVGLLTGGASIDILVVSIFLVVVLAVPGISAIIDLVTHGRGLGRPFLNPTLVSHAAEVRVAGDLLVAVWIAIWVLGPFKALLSPLFLALTGEFRHSIYANSFWSLLAMELLLLAIGVGVPVLYRFAIARRSTVLSAAPIATAATPAAAHTRVSLAAVARAFAAERDEQDGQTRAIVNTLGVVALSISAAGVVLLLLFPTTFSYLLGPVGTLVLLIGCWATIIGMLIVAFGNSKPVSIFQVLRLRSTPIVTLLIVVPLAISFVDVPPTLHAIRSTTGGTLAKRQTIQSAFALWNEQEKNCSTQLSNGESIRPLLLFAAQGGGIRAATWTVDVLRTLPAATSLEVPNSSDCASHATFLSSGASGGSIGIASFQPKGNPATTPAKASTSAFGGPNALAADIAGLLDGDLIGGVTGIRVPTPTNLANPVGAPWAWHDRTALQELTWESQAAQFSKPYDVAPAAPTGYLILNSEDSVTNCKVIVSQLNLAATSNPPTGNSNCAGPGIELSNTIDLEDYLGAKCMADLNWSTAAELSARFPVVSPPGRVSNQTLPAKCLTGTRANLQSMQLVDGGTADNSAIGSISDISPELAAVISRYNAKETGSSASPFVVPILIYASNDPGLDLTSAPNKTKPDALVPIAAVQDAQVALVSPSAWLTRISNGLGQVCVGFSLTHSGPGATQCDDAVAGTRALVPEGVVVASPSTQPAVSVPLGWSLSGFSRARLDLEAAAQAQCGSNESTVDKACRANRGYGKLGSVLDLFRYAVQVSSN